MIMYRYIDLVYIFSDSHNELIVIHVHYVKRNKSNNGYSLDLINTRLKRI